MRHTVLIVAHDEDLRLLLRLIARADPRIQLLDDAATADEALDRVAVDTLRPDVIVLDDRVGNLLGIDLAKNLVAIAPRMRILLLAPPFSATVPSLAVDGVLPKHELRSLPNAIATMLEIPPPDAGEPNRQG